MTEDQSHNWQQFLLSQGACFDDEGVSCYPEDAKDKTPPESWLTDLSYYGLLSVQGPDSAKFLQGQFTCDFDEISPQHSRLGAYCSPKGRMLSSFRVIQLENDRYLLRMQQAITENTRNTLEKYGVFFKSKIKTCQGMVGLGLAGVKTKAALHNIFNTTPESCEECLLVDGHAIVQLDDKGEQFECWLRIGEAANIWQQLSALLPARGSRQWDLINIQAGVGEVRAQTVETFIPQMLNFQTVGAISFEKGCYTGQEVVARTQYRGNLKRHMYRVSSITNEIITAGDKIYASGKEQSIGDVVMVANSSNNELQLLAVITSKDLPTPELHANSQDGPVLTVLSLPYESEL